MTLFVALYQGTPNVVSESIEDLQIYCESQHKKPKTAEHEWTPRNKLTVTYNRGRSRQFTGWEIVRVFDIDAE